MHSHAQTQHDLQDQFVAWLPMIQKQLRFAFRNLIDDSRDEATQEALANCWVHYEELHQQGRSEAASPTSLAQFAIRHVRCGRTVATPLNSREPLSRYAQQRHSITVERLEAATDSDDWLPSSPLTDARRFLTRRHCGSTRGSGSPD